MHMFHVHLLLQVIEKVELFTTFAVPLLFQKSDVARLEKELQSIKSQLMSAQNKLSSMTGTHEAEVQVHFYYI